MTEARFASRGALGGAGNELGGEHRAGVAAWFVAHGLVGRSLAFLLGFGVPDLVRCEVDQPVDDILIRFDGGRQVLVQAKARLDHGSAEFTSVIDQWKKAVRQGDVSVERGDRLVAAAGSLDEDLRYLQRGLRRRRDPHAGAPDKREADAVLDLETKLADCTEEQRRDVMAVAELIELPVATADGHARQAAEELLDGRVVAEGKGRAAFEALMGIVRERARLRSGFVIDGWLDALGERIDLLRGDQSRAATALARSDAVTRYRTNVIEQGRFLDLRQLGMDIPPVEVPCVALNLRCTTPDSESHDLVWAARRRGRVILGGLPGAGKSTALRQLAAYAAGEPGKPLPVLVDLRAVRDAAPETMFDRVIEEAVKQASVDDRPFLVHEIRERLRRGDALVLLDGLDECREERREVVRGLQRMLADVDPAVEVVLSTRDSAYASAHTLDWDDIRLAKPLDLDETLRRCCTAFAAARGVKTAARDAWVQQRLDWVSEMAKSEPVADETPLLRVLLVFLVATREGEALPKGRAATLSAVVEESAARVELGARVKHHANVGALVGAEAQDAALLGFDIIAHHIFSSGTGDVAAIQAELSKRLASDYNLGAGSARATADELQHLWDEAGIFVRRSDQTVDARLRILAEIGEARYVARLSERDQLEWVDSHIAAADASEALALAAGLSRSVADRLCERAQRAQEALLAARAIATGAHPSAGPLSALTATCIGHLQGTSPELGQLAWVLTELPVPERDRQAVLAALEEVFPAEMLPLVRASAHLTWNDAGSETETLLCNAIRVERQPKRGLVPTRYSETIVRIARVLVDRYPQRAPLVAAAMARVSIGASFELRTMLNRARRSELVQEYDEKRESLHGTLAKMKRWFDQTNDDWVAFLKLLSERSPHADPSRIERRRLDEIADLVKTLRIAESPVGTLGQAQQHPEALERLLEITMRLGGFGGALVAAEATIFAADSKEQRHSPSLLWDGAQRRSLERWKGEVDLAETSRSLLQVAKVDSWFADIALRALVHAPDPTQVVSALASVLRDLPGMSRLQAARVCTALDVTTTRWLEDSDPIVRMGAAGIVAGQWRPGSSTSDVLRVLLDRDLSVRAAALESLKGRFGPEVDAILQRAEASPGTEWTCLWDEERRAASDDTCSQRNPAPNVEKLIAEVRGEPYRDSRHVSAEDILLADDE